MIKLKLDRIELEAIVLVYDQNPISAKELNQEIILGIVQYDFILPARRKLLSSANRFTFSLRTHQVKALIEYFKALVPNGAYEKVRIYRLLDQALRQS